LISKIIYSSKLFFMKLLRSKLFWVTAILISFAGLIVSCTKNDQVLNLAPSTNETELFSLKTTTAPTIDGIVDASWSTATKLNVLPTVPDPGNNLFAGYIGKQYPATVRSMYDADNIYFLVEWNDATNNLVQPWYFDPGKKVWAQRANANQYDANGVLTKEGMGQDQLAILWNIDNSTPKFVTQTCYASCHIFSPYKNYAGVWQSNQSGNHYTNGINEKIDMWWCHLPKDLLTNQMDDQYQDFAGGTQRTDTLGGNGNGRHADDLYPPNPPGSTWTSSYVNKNTNPSNGAFNNTQSLKMSDSTATVSVPKWVIPDAANKAYYLATDTLSTGTAKLVTGVSKSGVLTYAGGGTIDPNGKPEYQDAAGTGTSIGAKCIPSFISAPLTEGRADITATGVFTTGSGWVVEIKRALKTPDKFGLKQDIDFTSLQDQQFGMAIFNSSNYQHGIQPNLVLKFKK
jgi:hypothetical protein